MSQQDNFSGGFILGAVLGGLAGGVLGAVLATRATTAPQPAESESNEAEETRLPARPRRRSLRVASEVANTEQSIEVARRSLEDKIAQLNEAIDGVRQQLGHVNGRAIDRESTIAEEP